MLDRQPDQVSAHDEHLPSYDEKEDEKRPHEGRATVQATDDLIPDDGSLDSAYLAKARVLNNAMQEIGG